MRLGQVARTTQDIDLVGWLALASDPDDLLDALEGALRGDFDDGFSFRAAAPRRLRGEGATSPAWRVPVEALVDGAHFAHIKLDLVGQLDEVEGATELIEVRAPIAAPACGAVAVTAVDVYQHAAEKLHAYSRLYAGGRPSSRVKDLVDLVLLIDAGLLVDARRLGTRLAVVWSVRDRTQPPASLPSPPPTWADDMARLLGGHGPPTSPCRPRMIWWPPFMPLPSMTKEPPRDPSPDQEVQPAADDPCATPVGDQGVAQHHAQGRRSQR
ncbi:nucleotidyl transferase AbiEii/AbiGii toxin family protein [Janibacter indicus]|uniref:nucleotidyl transferase AbiEii/AbiGii toxin family protein n=1 Tax=Janibacter indicus TaxID=857417 RepID=UPI003D9A5CA3